MNLAYQPGSLAITSLCNLFGGATLTLYTGTIPATPETAATGTSLYTWTFSTPAFSLAVLETGGYDTLNAGFVNTGGTYVSAGTAAYARATIATPAARANTTAYVRGNLVTAGSNTYVCIAPGTTSGTSTLTTATWGIVDGTAAFDFVGVSPITTLADFTVGTSGTDIVLGTTTIASGVTVTISSFALRVQTL